MLTRPITATALLALCCAPALPAQKRLTDLTSATLEELMNIEVYSAAKKPQTLATTAASAYVITAEDIRRSGIRTIPELLRLAPGVQVARTQSGAWAISIRGFADEYSNKLLVLVDGQSIYDELYGGIFWELQDMLVDDVERIEVIRGPGATMWGLNAVNGVINILTKSARETRGTLVKFAAGSETEVNGAVRVGGAIGSAASYRVSTYYAGHGAIEAPESPIPNSTHGWNIRRFDFRLDWAPNSRDAVRITGRGALSQTGLAVAQPTPENIFAPLRDTTHGSHSGSVQTVWERRLSERSSISVRAAWRQADRDEYLRSISTTGDVEFQHHLGWGRHSFMWGLNYRDVSRRVPPGASAQIRPVSSSQDTYAGFFEDQYEIVRDKLYFAGGLHVSSNRFTGIELQPAGRLLWTPNKKWTSWAAVSRAVRTPTLIERGMETYIAAFPLDATTLGVFKLAGNPSFGSEHVISYEAGQRYEFSKRFAIDASAFLSFYQHLASFANLPEVRFVPGAGVNPPYLELTSTFANGFRGHGRGAELFATWTANRRWRVAGGYSWLRVTSGGYTGQDPLAMALAVSSSPRHQFQVRSYFDLTRTLELDAAVYYYGQIPNGFMPELKTKSHARGDVRLGWRPRPGVNISVGVQNALDPSHLELPSTGLGRPVEVPRNVYGSVSFEF